MCPVLNAVRLMGWPNVYDSWYNETFNLLFYMRIYHGGLNTVNLYSNYCSTFLI